MMVAYNYLYAGCGGTVPSVYWQYYITGYETKFSPVLSSDGSQVAFMTQIATSYTLVLLKWAANSSLVGLTNTPAASYRNCTAPCATLVPYPLGGPLSAPFYDYANDVLYIGSFNGSLSRFTGVFNGTPAAAGSPWPVSLGIGIGLSSPVLDPVSGLVVVGSANGQLASVNTSLPPLWPALPANWTP